MAKWWLHGVPYTAEWSHHGVSYTVELHDIRQNILGVIPYTAERAFRGETSYGGVRYTAKFILPYTMQLRGVTYTMKASFSGVRYTVESPFGRVWYIVKSPFQSVIIPE